MALFGKKEKKKNQPKYLLKDFSRSLETEGYIKDDDLRNWVFGNLGRVVAIAPQNQWTKIDFTTAPGRSSGIYYSLMFQLRKWEYFVHRVDEWLEVSPVHAAYYQLTAKQKEELETKIKTSLASAAQAVSDLELLLHDRRKYQEFTTYFETKDEHSLKAVFIDQVDVHTGDISMRNIVARWPTLIIDFLKLPDEDIDPDVVRKKLDISKAEAVVLVTKNKLYQQWKQMFEPEIRTRLRRIEDLVRSRETSVEQYKEWIKPYIERYKLIKEGFEQPGRRKFLSTFFIPGGGHATSLSSVTLWAWREFTPGELKKPPGELPMRVKEIPPNDEWTMRELVFDKNKGLIVEYPWITKSWVDEQTNEILKDGWIRPDYSMYYSFFVIEFLRGIIRLADGTEIENGIWDVNTVLLSQNALWVKLLELRAKQEELERHINGLLGIPQAEEKRKVERIDIKNMRSEIKRMKDQLKKMKDNLKTIKPEDKKELGEDIKELEARIKSREDALKKKEEELPEMERYEEKKVKAWHLGPLRFFRGRGPYERNFDDRIGKVYLKYLASTRYAPIVGFIKEIIAMGE